MKKQGNIRCFKYIFKDELRRWELRGWKYVKDLVVMGYKDECLIEKKST